jgi:hypothetical protein
LRREHVGAQCRASARQRVCGADHVGQRFLHQRCGVQIGQMDIVEGDADIDLVIGQQWFHALLRHFAQTQRDIRIRRVKRHDQRRHQIGRERRRDRQPEVAAREFPHVMDGASPCFEVLQRAACVHVVRLAGVSQSHGAAAAIEQRRAE